MQGGRRRCAGRQTPSEGSSSPCAAARLSSRRRLVQCCVQCPLESKAALGAGQKIEDHAHDADLQRRSGSGHSPGQQAPGRARPRWLGAAKGLCAGRTSKGRSGEAAPQRSCMARATASRDSRVQSGPKSTASTSEPASSDRSSCPRASHTFTTPSQLPDASCCPPGANASARTESLRASRAA